MQTRDCHFSLPFDFLFFGRFRFWISLAAPLVPGLIIHARLLPKHGINGWTGEPKDKYYEMRGWKNPKDTH